MMMMMMMMMYSYSERDGLGMESLWSVFMYNTGRIAIVSPGLESSDFRIQVKGFTA
jgi:hypothetical protein